MKDIFYESTKDTRNIIFAEKQIQYNGRLHFHRAFELAYICTGQARYIVEDDVFTANAGDIVFTHCYYRHRSLGEPIHTKYVIAVPENLTRDITDQFSASTLPALLPDKEFNRTLLPHFEELTAHGNSMSRMLSKGYANVIFGSLESHYHTISVKPKNKSVSLIADILDYVDAHYREPISLDHISAHFGYNKTYFSSLFNRHVGLSLNNYVNMVRLDHLEALKTDFPNENITNLVFACGFSSLATYYRVRDYRNHTNFLNFTEPIKPPPRNSRS